MRHPALIIASVFTFSGCQLEEAAPVGQAGSLAASVQAAQRRMHARFTSARMIEEAIARGDLDRARAEAHALTELDEPDMQPAWRPYLDNIRVVAQQVEASSSASSAAVLAATLGERCAQCHEAIAARIKFVPEPKLTSEPKLAGQMRGHQWAAARMWEGLIGPSDERWLTGATALTAVPLTFVAQAATRTSEFDGDDAARVRLYATRAVNLTARVAGTQDARAELFGKLLATCAHCHAALRDR